MASRYRCADGDTCVAESGMRKISSAYRRAKDASLIANTAENTSPAVTTLLQHLLSRTESAQRATSKIRLNEESGNLLRFQKVCDGKYLDSRSASCYMFN